MADSMSEEQTDLNKMKVPDLKKLLKSRGLSIVGNKQELIDRLQSSDAAAEALLEGSEVGDIIDEELDRELDETLDDEPAKEVEETSPLKEEEEKVQVETPPEPAKVEVARRRKRKRKS
uniref:SAP domain-containing ribonucleoprotein n=1 Tax=Lygus hesperus TaxID=30085 RepID=A0A0A9YC99_LYGHE